MLNFQLARDPGGSPNYNFTRIHSYGAATLLMIMMYGSTGTAAVASNGDPEPSMLDMHLATVVADVQNLGLAIQLADSNSGNAKSLSDLLRTMLGDKLDEVTHFLPRTENKEVERLACRVLKRTTKDIYAATDSCANSELCDKAYYAAQVCVAKGYAAEEEVAIPEDD